MRSGVITLTLFATFEMVVSDWLYIVF